MFAECDDTYHYDWQIVQKLIAINPFLLRRNSVAMAEDNWPILTIFV